MRNNTQSCAISLLRKISTLCTILDMDQEILLYARRLDLSTGDLLSLAREVAEDARLRTVDDLTMHQREALLLMLAFLSGPIHVSRAA